MSVNDNNDRHLRKLNWPTRFAGMLLVVVLLTGCVHRSGTQTICLVDQPILTNNGDQLTDSTAEQIEEHNVIWERLCEGAR